MVGFFSFIFQRLDFLLNSLEFLHSLESLKNVFFLERSLFEKTPFSEPDVMTRVRNPTEIVQKNFLRCIIKGRFERVDFPPVIKWGA